VKKILSAYPRLESERKDVKFDACYIDDGKVGFSLNINAFKIGVKCYIVYVIAFEIINFFTGLGIGGIDAGTKYLGYFMAISGVLVLFFVPIVGTIIAISFNMLSSQIMALFSVLHNAWIDVMINAMTIVAGTCIQVFAVAWFINIMTSCSKLIFGNKKI
jgi:hypothetical protein